MFGKFQAVRVVRVMNKSATRLMAGLLCAAIAISIGTSVSGADPGTSPDGTTTTTTSTVVETTIDTSTTTTTTTTTTLPLRKPRVLLVGDSTMAALRWFKDAKKSLSGAAFIVNVESCRSIGGYSCWGREGRAPSTAYEVIQSVKGRLDVVVLMAGTHHNPSTVESDLRAVRRLTAAKGAKLVVVTLRELLRGGNPVTTNGISLVERINEMIERMFQTPKYKTTYIADWKAFSAGRSSWFRSDGIHLTVRGALALGWFLSRIAANVAGAPCASAGTEVCPLPRLKDSRIDWLRRYRVEYTETHCYEDGSMRRKVCERDRRLW